MYRGRNFDGSKIYINKEHNFLNSTLNVCSTREEEKKENMKRKRRI